MGALGQPRGLRYAAGMEDAGFTLHPRLAEDCTVLGDLPVSRLLLMNDARFPWCILVPRRSGLRELHELPAGADEGLLKEIAAVSRALISSCGARKINVGALGNVVEQLHVHVVGRSADDAAWPGPVWGTGPAVPYGAAALQRLAGDLRRALRLAG
jgi:diadenosine tetraphosphate (Ap4A) HIT family hydrolase